MELRQLEILPLWKGDLTFKCELSHLKSSQNKACDLLF